MTSIRHLKNFKSKLIFLMMFDIKAITNTKENLTILTEKIAKGEYGADEELFRGADIMVLNPGNPLIKAQDHWLDNDVRIVTPFCKELSWLLIQLRDVFYEYELIDASNKEEFFGDLGQAALEYNESVEDGIGNVENLLETVYKEAENILQEILLSLPHGE